tara:strand:- start:72 stop:2081 length:2010 start_codon:yes stop_codon:yes gene_type:complete
MDSYFEKGVKLKGTLWVKGKVHFDGELEGEVYSSDHFMVGKTGVISGDIKTFNVTNMGHVKGNLFAENRVSLTDESSLLGDITTYHLVIDEGSNFEGRCKMVETQPKNIIEEESSTPPKSVLTKKQSIKIPAIIENLSIKFSEPKNKTAAISILIIAVAIGFIYPQFNSKLRKDSIDKAFSLLKNKRFDSAEEEFKIALTSGSTDPKVHEGLGLVYMQKGDPKKAAEHFRKSIKLNPSEKSYRLELAKAYQANQQWDKGFIAFQDLANMDNSNHEAYFGLGVEFNRRGEYKKAIKNLEMALKLNPQFHQSHKALAGLFLKRGQYNRAKSEIEKALILNDKDPLAYLTLGEIYFKQKKPEEGVKAFKKVTKMLPQNFESQIRLADWYYQKGSLDESFRYYKAAESLRGKNPEVLTRLGKIYFDRKENKKAQKAFQKAVNINPTDGNSFYHLGLLQASERKWEKAFTSLNKAKKYSPGNDKLHYELGRVLMAQGDAMSAESEINKAIKLNPTQTEYHKVLSEAYIEQKKFDEAVAILNKAVGLQPKKADLIYQLCHVYVKKGFLSIGIRHCKQAIDLKPNFYNAMNRLAWLYAKKKTNLVEAFNLSKKTIQAFPKDPGYIDTLSEIYYVQGKKDKAIENIKKAIELDPKNAYYKQQLWKFNNVAPKPAIKG